MNNNTKRAVVAMVKVGPLDPIEGLMAEDGEYGVAVPQYADIFETNRQVASRAIKRLMAKASKTSTVSISFQKWKTEFNQKPVNVILLDDWADLIVELAFSGNAKAQNMVRALHGMAWTQFFADAFNQKFEKNERQEYVTERLKGKSVRRELTDAIKDYLVRNKCSENEHKWMYVHVSDKLNKLLFGLTAKQLCQKYKCPNAQLRDQFNRTDIVNIRRLEEYAMRLVDRDNIHPTLAIEQAFNFWIAS